MAFGSFIFTLPHFIAEPFTNAYNSDNAALSKCYRKFFILSYIFVLFFLAGTNQSTFLDVKSAKFDALKSCPSPENQVQKF